MVRRALLVLCPLAFLGPNAAAAQSQLEFTQYGARAGLSSGPDPPDTQITIGAFADFGQLFPLTHLRTSADLGFGDDVFTIAINGDLAYFIETVDFPGQIFVGGGLTFARYRYDEDSPGVSRVPGDTENVDDTSTKIGLGLLAGVEKDLSGYKKGSVELRIGIGHIPDLKITGALGFF